MRKPSPISISSPRETSTSRPSASAASASSIAPALLLTTIAALGAGEPAQDPADVILARAARARGEVVLEVRVAAPGLDDAVERRRGERRPAEVRVHDHAGRVQDATQLRPARRGELLPEPRGEVAGIGARAELLARPGDHRARGVHRKRIVRAAGELVHRRQDP